MTQVLFRAGWSSQSPRFLRVQVFLSFLAWECRMVFPGAKRVALVVMVLGFSGVLVTTLLNLSDATRRTLVVLFAAALLCSGFVALVVWFAVSGASGGWS